MPMAFIKVENLRKDYRISRRSRGFLGLLANLVAPRYTVKPAVDGIDFSIDKGEMVGFIGPNGAGKSTTVKILSGILHPTSGSVTVDGLVPYRERKRHVQRIGVGLGQKSQLWWDLPVYESYDMLRYIYKIDKARYRANLAMVQELLGLAEFFEQPVRQLSLGQRMKADLGAAFLHDPDILFLDEPTIGLDVVAKENVRNFLVQMNRERGITMLFTTHDMQDIEKTCRRMIIIDHGRKVYDGSIRDIRAMYSGERELVVELAEECLNLELEHARVVHQDGRVKRIKFRNADIAVQDLIGHLNRHYAIADLELRDTEIESIIREIYRDGAVHSAGVR